MIDSDEEHDDIIRLFDIEQNKVFSCTLRKDVIEDFSEDEDTELKATLGSHKSISTMLPAAFYDIESNVELLERCRPISIKLVDCNKFPCYNEKHSKSNKHCHHNSKSFLQEPDCIEILSSDENDIYDTIVERTVSKDIADIKEEFNRSRFITESSILENKVGNTQKKYKSRSWQNNNTLLVDNNGNCDRGLEKYSAEDFDINSNRTPRISDNICLSKKRNKSNKCGAVEGDYIQDNKEIDTEVTKKNKKIDSKSRKRRRNSKMFTQYCLEETYIDKIDTYARLIDKAYTNLQTKKPLVGKKYIETNDTVKYRDDQNVPKPKSHITNKPETVKSKTSNDKTNCTLDEVSKNNDSFSPILPCPPQINKSNNLNTKNMAFDAPLSSFIKHTIEKEYKNGFCANQFYSANRVIPHYHNETIQKTRPVKSSNVYQNISKKSTVTVENMQRHNENVVCEGNDYFKNQSKFKQNKTVDGNFGDFSDIATKNDINPAGNQFTLANSDIPNINTNNCIPYYNGSQELNNKFKESLARGVSIPYDLLISSEADYESKYDSSEINKMSGILGRKPKYPYCNDTTSTFPVQSIISNQDNFQSIDFSVNADRCNAICMPNTQNFIHSGVNPNYFKNEFCNYELSRPQIGNAQTLSTPYINNHCINNLESSLCINNGNKYTSESHKRLLAIENLHQGQSKTTRTSSDKYSTLKEHLERAPLKVSPFTQGKSTYINTKSNQRMDKKKNNNTQLNQQNRSTTVTNKNITLISDSNFNTDKEKVLAALVATDYVTQKALSKEENTNRTFGGEVSIREGKYKYNITQLLNQPLQGVNKPDIKNKVNGCLGQSNDLHMYNLMSSDHSQTFLIP